MKLVILTNFYPPRSRGGYEQWCQEVTDGLVRRGHELLVLTSTYGRDGLRSPDPAWVFRDLHLEMEFASLRNAFQFFTKRKKRELENLTNLRKVIENHKPDAILIWGMWNIPRSVPVLAEKMMPGRVVYYIGDYWVTLPSQWEDYWNAPSQNALMGFPKMVLRPIARQIMANEKRPDIQLEHALFPSEFMRDELTRKGVSTKHAEVVHGAIDTALYLDRHKDVRPGNMLSLLYIGRLTHEKGVHTAIEAVGQLVHVHGFDSLSLTIVGDGDADYVINLHQLAERKNITSYVTFLPAQPKNALPPLYNRSDIFLFTSIWAEPFGRVIVEAMASGTVVVGTAVGGAAEILVDGRNALLFKPDDPASLSLQLMRLIESPAIRKELADTGRQTAVDKFDIRRMIIEIESYMQSLMDK